MAWGFGLAAHLLPATSGALGVAALALTLLIGVASLWLFSRQNEPANKELEAQYLALALELKRLQSEFPGPTLATSQTITEKIKATEKELGRVRRKLPRGWEPPTPAPESELPARPLSWNTAARGGIVANQRDQNDAKLNRRDRKDSPKTSSPRGTGLD